MTRVYIFDDMADFDGEALRRGLAMVSSGRREKALKYKFEKDRKLSVIAGLLLRYGVADAFGLVELPEIGTTDGGKPIFPSLPNLHFSLSHCNAAVACAMSDDGPVGVDVEPYKSYRRELAERVLNRDELAGVDGSQSPAAEFIRLWTMKESVVKYTGLGLVYPLADLLSGYPGLAFSTYHYPSKGYALSICQPTPTATTPTPIPVSLASLLS